LGGELLASRGRNHLFIRQYETFLIQDAFNRVYRMNKILYSQALIIMFKSPFSTESQ